MTIDEFAKKNNFTQAEKEYYIERCGIRHFDGLMSKENAHRLTMGEIMNKRKEGVI